MKDTYQHSTLKPDPIDLAVYLMGTAGFLALLVSVIVTVPVAFDIVFNWYSVLAAASVIANVWLLAILARRPVQGEAMIWLSLFIFLNLLWGSAEVMHRLMLTPEGNAFWSHMQFALVSFLPTMLYLFIRSYTQRASISDTWRTPTVFVGGSVAVAVLITANGVLPVMGWETRETWGYPAPANLPALMYVAWNSLISAAAVARLLLAYRKELNPRRRKPLLWLAISAAALCVGEAMTAVVSPALGMGGLPPLGVLANTIMAIGIIYTILRYGAFSLNIGPLADAVLAGMGEAVLVTDQSGRIIYANTAAEGLMGGNGQATVGRHLSRIATGQLRRALQQWQKLPSAQSGTPVEIAIKSAGEPCILNVRITDADQAGWGHVFVLSDITSLRAANQKLEESQAELAAALGRSQQLEHQVRREKAGVELKVAEATAVIRSEHARLVTSINSLHLGLVMTDAAGQLVIVNHETQVVLARSLGLGHGALAVEAASLKSPLDRLFGLSAKVSTCLATRTGQRYPVMDVADRLVAITVSPILDEGPQAGHLLGAVALIEDVTDAENLERARDEFFSIASHELRTPLTAIRGNSGMLLDMPAADLAAPDAREMLSDVHDASVRLIKVVNDFLDVALVEEGLLKYQLEPVDAAALVTKVVAKRTAPSSHVVLEVEGVAQPRLVLADSRRLEQVILELLDNAAKHTIAGSIRVKLGQIGEHVTISVADTGKGIDPEHRRLLFRKFQLASDSIFTRDGTRSTGLGLYLARRLMLGMGGRLELAISEPEIGSTFTITLPQASIKPKKSLAREKS